MSYADHSKKETTNFNEGANRICREPCSNQRLITDKVTLAARSAAIPTLKAVDKKMEIFSTNQHMYQSKPGLASVAY